MATHLIPEFGDRIGVLAHRADFPALRKYFGDWIKGTAEFSYISIGIGMALGFLLGAIQFPLPGIGKLALVIPIVILGLFVFRMPFDEVAGIVAGACGNPAILAYSNKLMPSDRTDLGYAMIFPGMTIIKILFVDIVPAFF